MCVNGARAGGIQIPGCTIASLINACNQFIEELEDFEEVPDMQMLARLVVIREEACNIDLQNRIKEGVAEVATNPLLASKAVPVTEIAFLKQLMPLSVGDARCGMMGMLLCCFDHNHVGAGTLKRRFGKAGLGVR